jgi:integrase
MPTPSRPDILPPWYTSAISGSRRLSNRRYGGRWCRATCDAADPPRVTHKQAATWTADEVKRFLSYAQDDTYHPYWLLAVATGMRRGELLGLRWQDVDIARSRVHVRQSVTVGKRGAPIFQEPKTPKARRVVPIPVEVTAALHAHRVRQNAIRLACGPAWRDHDLVFTVADGGPINPGNLLRNMRAIIAKANKDAKKDNERLPVLTIHALRHTHATLLLQQGQNAKVIQERLGHANISMTLSTYSHVLPDMQEHASDAIGAMLFGEAASAREVIVK